MQRLRRVMYLLKAIFQLLDCCNAKGAVGVEVSLDSKPPRY